MKLLNYYKWHHKVIKKSMQLTCLLMVLILPISCKKYLDVKSQSVQEIPSTITDCQLLLNYNGINVQYPVDGESSSDDLNLSDDNFGALSNDNQAIYEWLPNADHLNAPNSGSWFSPYSTILVANLVLQTYDKLSAADQASAAGQNVKGQALFFRATYFHELAQLYAKPYNTGTASTDLGIPLRMTATITEKLSRATVKQTYDQIIADLTTAIAILPSYTSFTSQPTKAAGYAELARVYLSMGDYANALINANNSLAINSALVDYNTLNLNNYYPFTTFPLSNKEVLFEGAEYGTITSYSFVSNDLVNLYDSNDLRKSLFFSDNGNGGFYFIGSYTGDYTFFAGLATDEMYLIKAECEARANSTGNALNDLNALLITRYKTGTFVPVTASSADDALAKILIERRKELLYRNIRWSDLRRLNQDPRFAITLSRTVGGKVYTLPPNDPRYTLLIPADVIQYGGYPQNPR